MNDHQDLSAGCSMALMLGLSPLFLAPLLALVSVGFPWLWPLCMAYGSALVCVLAIWLAIGNSSFWVRLLFAMLPGAALGLFLLLNLEEPWVGRLVVFATLALVVPLASLPSFGLRSLGYRLVLQRARSADGELPEGTRPLQFSLRQLFGVTVAVAVYAFVGKLIARDGARAIDDGLGMLVFVLLSLSAAGAAWAALGRAKPAGRLFLIAVISGSIMMLLAMSFSGAREPDIFISAAWLALHPLAVGAALVLFREIGYRLIRLPPTENASAQEPVH